MGREALAWLRDARPDVDPVVFYTRDGSERPRGAGIDIPVVSTLARLRDVGVDAVVLAVGDVDRRAEISAELREAALSMLAVVHPSSFIGPGVSVGEGAIVAPGCIITRDVTIAPMAILNYGAKVGHDCSIGTFAFIGPGAVLTGAVTLEGRSFVGAGAVVLPGISIGEGATVGAGAVVTADVPRGATVVGNPAVRISPEGAEDDR
jgi:sugar O-acyltransferase (sialic acid O-acetyltransferase NeuD family)